MSASPSVHFTHNSELEPSEEYLAGVPRLRPALVNPALVETFERYDAVANAKQRLLWRMGITSLVLASIGLSGIATKQYPGMGTGDPDLYKAFCWRFWHLVADDGGRIGVVLPRSALAAKGSRTTRSRT